jgi:hypothetical protein
VRRIVQQYLGEVVPCANPVTIFFVFTKFDKNLSGLGFHKKKKIKEILEIFKKNNWEKNN